MSAPDPPPLSQYVSSSERSARDEIEQLLRDTPLPPRELLENLGLYINRQLLTRMLFMDELYRQALSVHGVVMEFGCRWGQNLALFSSLRGMYEPYNHTRRIIGFDTFEGFVGVNAKDGEHPAAAAGGYGVSAAYEDYLERILAYHEQESPLSQMRKFELLKGDVGETLPAYLERHPETIVALAYFDMDLYEPTKAALEAIRGLITRGTVIAFDELGYADWPGETLALKEVFGLDRFRIVRSPANSVPSYVVVD